MAGQRDTTPEALRPSTSIIGLALVINSLFQLDNSDEQAAAIRRELDARQEEINKMERVRMLSSPFLASFNHMLCNILESKINAQVCSERNGISVHRGNEPSHQYLEVQP